MVTGVLHTNPATPNLLSASLRLKPVGLSSSSLGTFSRSLSLDKLHTSLSLTWHRKGQGGLRTYAVCRISATVGDGPRRGVATTAAPRLPYDLPLEWGDFGRNGELDPLRGAVEGAIPISAADGLLREEEQR